MTVPWWQRRMVAFDLETTSPLPEEARIVEAALAFCGGGEPTDARTWLLDPGVEIPAGAIEVHGITNERVRADGMAAGDGVALIAEALRLLPGGSALVIFNARYDATVFDRELRRHGHGSLASVVGELLVVDPSVIDKFLWRYRKSYPGGDETQPSTRTLEGMCGVYDATLDAAHDATFDAVAAARLAYRMGQRGDVIRRVRGAHEGRELAALKREWADVRNDLRLLHDAQRRWALAERVRFAEYKRSNGEPDEADRIEMEKDWPVLAIMGHEEWAR